MPRNRTFSRHYNVLLAHHRSIQHNLDIHRRKDVIILTTQCTRPGRLVIGFWFCDIRPARRCKPRTAPIYKCGEYYNIFVIIIEHYIEDICIFLYHHLYGTRRIEYSV